MLDTTYSTREEARRDIVNYNEMFYNSKRRHSNLGYLSLKEFEKVMTMKKAAQENCSFLLDHVRFAGYAFFTRLKCKSYFCSFAKKAAAFFRISRSMWSRLFSIRKRRNSIWRAALLSGLPSFFSSQNSLSHVLNKLGWVSRFRAASQIEQPNSVTSFTASFLNFRLCLFSDCLPLNSSSENGISI